MGLRHSLRASALAALLILAGGCSDGAERSGRTVMCEGPDAVLPERTDAPDIRALHLRAVGGERVLALRFGTGLRDLNLSANGLTALPDAWLPPALERLWLADNRLTALPEGVAGLPLTYLNLDRNALTALPDLSAMPLRFLRLSGNRLTGLPELPDTLERLYLADNLLTALSVHRPAALRQLTLAGNPMKAVPPTLGEGLEWLDLSRMPLTALPEDLSRWSTLRVLKLSGCPLPESEKDRIEAAFEDSETTVIF